LRSRRLAPLLAARRVQLPLHAVVAISEQRSGISDGQTANGQNTDDAEHAEPTRISQQRFSLIRVVSFVSVSSVFWLFVVAISPFTAAAGRATGTTAITCGSRDQRAAISDGQTANG
jgi:hypothetical protein